MLTSSSHLSIRESKKNGGQVLKIAEPYDGAPVYNVIMVDPENNQVTVSEMVSDKMG